MSTGELYRIEDEPEPGSLAKLTVNPLFPMLAFMLGGSWLGWPWLVLNGWAMGSATRMRELAFVVAGWLGTLPVFYGVVAAFGAVGLDDAYVPLAASVTLVFKVTVSYFTFVAQMRSFQLYRYFGGPVRNGLLLALASMFARGAVLGSIDDTYLVVLLS